MEVLNPSPVLTLPKTMWLAWEALAHRPDVSEAQLIDLIRPEVIRAEAPQQGAHATRAVAGLRELRLIKVDEEGLLRPVGEGGLDAFTSMLRRAVLVDPSTVDGTFQGAPDLRAGIFWLMEMSPVEPLHWNDNVQGLTTPEVLKNDTRWNGFRTWATFLGFGRIASSLYKASRGDRLLSNPYDAVRQALSTAVAGGATPGVPIPIGQFLSTMDEQLPIFRRAVTNASEGPNLLSRGIAFGLLGLEQRGYVALERQSDATGAIGLPDPFDGRDIRYVSAVTIAEAAK